MNNQDDKNLFLPIVFISSVVSFLLGLFAFFLMEQKVPMNADKILNRVKDQFKEDGPIEGSWIEMTKVPWKNTRTIQKSTTAEFHAMKKAKLSNTNS